MNLLRCPHGHFYDASKHDKCPHCQADPLNSGYGALAEPLAINVADKGAGARGMADKGAGARGAADKGAGARGAAGRGAGDRGAGARGMADKGTGARGVADKGSGAKGSGAMGGVARVKRWRGEKGGARPGHLLSEESVRAGLAGLVAETFDSLVAFPNAQKAARPHAQPYGDKHVQTHVVARAGAGTSKTVSTAVIEYTSHAARSAPSYPSAPSPVAETPTPLPALELSPVAETPTPLPALEPSPVADPPAPDAAHGRRSRSGQPVVGWLVCVEGCCKGADFKLRAGRNYIGRSIEMDVAIPGDAAIARDRHASVAFDPQNRLFVAVPGESAEHSYLNGSMLLMPTQLESYDILAVGGTKFVFIPLCGERFAWDVARRGARASLA